MAEANALRVVRYSALSIAVLGNSFSIKDQLHAMGGKWNAHLFFEGRPTKGWVFRSAKLPDVERLVASLRHGGVAAASPMAAAVPPALTHESAVSSPSLSFSAPATIALEASQSGQAHAEREPPASFTDSHASDGAGEVAQAPVPASPGPLLNAAVVPDPPFAMASPPHSAEPHSGSPSQAVAAGIDSPAASAPIISTAPDGRVVLIPASSKTFSLRARLGQLGGVWQPAERMWVLPAGSYNEAKALLESQPSAPPAALSQTDSPASSRRGVRRRERRTTGMPQKRMRMRDVLSTIGTAVELLATISKARDEKLIADADAAVAADPRYRHLDRDSSRAISMTKDIAETSMGHYPLISAARRPTACEDCGRTVAVADDHRRSPWDVPDPPAISHCDRRFRMVPGPALSAKETLNERRRALADYANALDSDAGMGSLGLTDTDFVYRRIVDKKIERRSRDREQNIGHCGVIVCAGCASAPNHTCRNESAISSSAVSSNAARAVEDAPSVDDSDESDGLNDWLE